MKPENMNRDKEHKTMNEYGVHVADASQGGAGASSAQGGSVESLATAGEARKDAVRVQRAEDRDAQNSSAKHSNARLFLGEFIGTYLMVLFGVGAAAVTTFFGSMTGNYQVGMVWGISIAILIYVCRHLSGAHFNPAVSVAMVAAKRMPVRELPAYIIGQLIGAFGAALTLWGMFAGTISRYLPFGLAPNEATNSIAKIWIDTYPNDPAAYVNTLGAAFAEGFTVFILIIVIFSLTSTENTGRPNTHLAPLFIGLTVAVIIGLTGPLTNTGINPARDLGPRLVGALMGFANAFTWQAIVVYTVSPLVACLIAAFVYDKIIKPLHKRCLVSEEETPCHDGHHLCGQQDCDRKLNAHMN